jgi:hypothetical protein
MDLTYSANSNEEFDRLKDEIKIINIQNEKAMLALTQQYEDKIKEVYFKSLEKRIIF